MHFKGFQDSKNWQCCGKILYLLFFVYFVSKWGETPEKRFFLHFWKQAVLFFLPFGWDWHLKTTKIETSKTCIWTVSLNWEAKLSSWGSSFNFFLNRVAFFKFHWRRSTTWDSTPYNPRCCSKASKTQGTDHSVVKYLLCFSLSILFQNKEKPLKKDLLALQEGSNGFI